MMWPPTRSTLFPYTTLFRSLERLGLDRSRIDGPGVKRLGFRQFGFRQFGFRQFGFKRFSRRLDRPRSRSEEHTSELQSHSDLVCRLLLEKKKRHFDPGK